MTSTQVDAGMPSLDYLHTRDELLQIMYWMMGEGLGTQPSAAQIEAFLGADQTLITECLERMATEGFVTATGDDAFQLTERGLQEGRRSFADEFAGLTRQGHGECAPDCVYCHGPDGDPSSCPSKTHAHTHAATG